MSIFNSKYKVKGQLQGGRVVYDVYFRKWWFGIPYWKKLMSDPGSIDDAVVRIRAHVKQHESMVARWLRIR